MQLWVANDPDYPETGALITSTIGVVMETGATEHRALSGMVILEDISTLRQGTVLQTGTKVVSGTDRTNIDDTLAAFGVATNATADTVSSASTAALAKDYVLAGDVTMAATPAGILEYLIAGTDEHDKTMLNESVLFATSSAAVLCVGTCSAFGGIPAAKGNLTGASGALYKGYVKAGKYNGPNELVAFAGKTINVPGCPPHPDWIVGTIAHLLATNFQIPELEAYARPMAYFGQYQCNAGPCEWRYNQGYDATEELNYFNPKVNTGSKVSAAKGAKGRLPAAHATINSSRLFKHKWDNDVNGVRYLGCIGPLGCKGRKTKADCSLRRWNGDNALPEYGTNWCVGTGAGCHGCTEPTFPDKLGKFFNFA